MPELTSHDTLESALNILGLSTVKTTQITPITTGSQLPINVQRDFRQVSAIATAKLTPATE